MPRNSGFARQAGAEFIQLCTSERRERTAVLTEQIGTVNE
jgi:hypothetical protein